MDISLKDGVYFGSVLVAFVWNYANTNKKIDMNKKELNSLKEMLDVIIEKEKTLFQKEFDSINSKLDAYFSKVNDISNRLRNLEKKEALYIEKDEVLRQHPTKDEINNKLNQLEKTDINLKNEILSLKKDINKKFDKLEESLQNHIKEERETAKQNQDILNKILLNTKDK